MVGPRNPERAQAALRRQADGIPWLRGTGPNPFEYGLWEQRTRELAREIFGEESPEMARYYEAVGVRGRLPGVRGQDDNMTLNIFGDWGILARLGRAESVLAGMVATLGDRAASSPR